MSGKTSFYLRELGSLHKGNANPQGCNCQRPATKPSTTNAVSLKFSLLQERNYFWSWILGKWITLKFKHYLRI
jgi:hypothetical protein